jgi:hypothetical protein
MARASTMTMMLAKFRHVASGCLAVAGTGALTLMAVRQYNLPTAQLHELWFLGLMVAITFEALANFFRPASVGPKISIWSLTLMGCSCIFGGFAMKQGAVLALGGVMIAAGYVLAVFVPNPAALGTAIKAGGGEHTPGQPPHPSDNAAR